ncbi:MAG: response regulator [Gammaproteobacteria bacterium]|nr:response regulator [Gammaproteobacteria bacterium]
MVSDQRKGQYALVVDDNRVNRRVAGAMLKRMGYTDIVEAEDGLQALERVKSAGFDLILMDCEMPIMDGFESTRQIRQWESESQRSAALIIALTARVMAGDRQRCLDAGMNEYITKPLGYEQLQALVRREADNRDAPSAVSPVDDEVQAVNDERYEKMCSLLREGVEEFYRDYLAVTWEKINDIQSHPDMPLAKSARLIHSIRGSAGNVGANQLYQLAEKLEHRLEYGETDVLYQQVGQLRMVLDRLEVEIGRRLDDANGEIL